MVAKLQSLPRVGLGGILTRAWKGRGVKSKSYIVGAWGFHSCNVMELRSPAADTGDF